MQFLIDVSGKQNPDSGTDSKYTIAYIIYFVALTGSAAFFSTSEAKSFFNAAAAMLFKIAESIAAN